jgi:hypothetical protein
MERRVREEGGQPMSPSDGVGTGVGRRQGCSKGCQAAVQVGGISVTLLDPAAAAAASDPDAGVGGAYSIASRQPPK